MPASTPLDRALWNVAEVASRYSDAMAAPDRRQAWQEIEAAVASVRALCSPPPPRPLPIPAPGPSPALVEQVAAARRMAEVLRERGVEAECRLVEAEALTGQAVAARDAAVAERDAARSDRDAALAARAEAEANQGCLAAERDALRYALARAEAERDIAVSELTRPPGSTPVGEASDPVRVECEGVLAVRATSWNLLPESFAGLLVPGARILRQDGRLAALLAVPCEAGGAMSAEATEQAGRMVALGFRVDWVEEGELVS